MAKNYFADCKRGDTFNTRKITFRMGDGTPMDLTGVTAKMQFRASKNGNVIFEFNTSDGYFGLLTIPNPQNGEMFMMARVMTVPENKYMFDLQLTFPNTLVKTYLSDFWSILNDISR